MKFFIGAILIAVLSATFFGQNSPERVMPDDFVSDGCSMFPDGDYRDCCVVHDKAYYFGGTRSERLAADNKLYQCVRSKGHKYIAPTMWLGVRLGGVSFLPTTFRWGFGNNKSK